MTTPAAAAQYLREHQSEYNGRPYVVYNPNNQPVENLPTIFGFNNGGQIDWLAAVAIAEDGTVLGSHICSHEGYMPFDLGLIEGTREDRHENEYRPHYPNGYKMSFVSYKDVNQHEALQRAFKLNEAKNEAED